MKEFAIHLQSPSHYERIDGVESFVGIDESGSFGILPGHERMATVLSSGIARLRLKGGALEYLGLPEAVLYFVDNELFISSKRYLKEKDYAHLANALQEKSKKEKETRSEMRETIQRIEEALLRQLLRREGGRSL